MSHRALIIGIDDYADQRQKLTSAVKDALAFRDALLDHGLADAPSIELLTAPLVEHSAGLADSKTILRALERYYRAGDVVEKLIFYYAGHGISALSDSAGARARTVLVPVDVEDLQSDGRSLIDLDELRELFAQTGPVEQLFFIDACRDLDYTKQPSVASLGFSGVSPGPARRQATLFAVSPLGKANATVGGHGAFTEQLLEGLRGEGKALDFDATLDAYVITVQSLHEHARGAILERLKGETAWIQSIQPPQLIASSPGPAPLRTFEEVAPRALRVHIEPDSAAEQTEVLLALRRQTLGPDLCYPQRRNHETVLLEPQLYSVRASSRVGRAEPAHATVDVRVVREHTVRILLPQSPGVESLSSGVPDADVVHAAVTESQRLGFTDGDLDSGTVIADALEPFVTISLTQLESPYLKQTRLGSLRAVVAAGPYRVDFQLGTRVFSSSEIYVSPEVELRVLPRAALTALLGEALGSIDPADVVISESIGPMQAGVVGTALAILGVKPFDLRRELFSQFEDLVPVEDPADYDFRPVSIVVAADGNAWPGSVADMLDGVECRLFASAEDASARMQRPLRSTLERHASSSPEEGWQRVRCGLVRPPGAAFEVAIRVPRFGGVQATSAALRGRVTEIVCLLRPNGEVELHQQILPLPAFPIPPAEVPWDGNGPLRYGPFLRLLSVAHELHRSGQLLAQARRDAPSDGLVRDLRALLLGTWVDPLLSCMAYHACWRDPRLASDVADLAAIARGLETIFGELPDVRLVLALERSRSGGEDLDGQLAEILAASDEEPPLLLESAQHLAAFALRSGRPDASIVERVRRARPDQPWLEALVSEGEDAFATVGRMLHAYQPA